MRPIRKALLSAVLAALLSLAAAGTAFAWDDGGVVNSWDDGGIAPGSVEDGGISN
ncbi:MAG TPA: hypothetical protein VFM93_13140 [Candidatus Limnocylindria bacterium]|nr:hypothetical protein [Candidatus Limnocylindria bacterium]